tara:strand:+ start:2531 stop:3001 length:471 start_codon:yes stop_codon:yes gene_type:complete
LYNDAVSRGDTLPISSLVAVFGDSFGKSRISEAAHQISGVVFDGESRVAQIERAAISDGDITGDGIALYTFGSGHGSNHYHAPLGSRIESLAFTEDGLDVVLHGNLRMGSYRHTIDTGNPETYRIEWSPHGPPTVDNIYDLVWQRHQGDAVRAADN